MHVLVDVVGHVLIQTAGPRALQSQMCVNSAVGSRLYAPLDLKLLAVPSRY